MRVLIGDMFETHCQTLVNTVNCVGVMGKGLAERFKNLYPDMYRDYKRRCSLGEVEPGVPYLFEDMLGTSILNFPTKDHWRSSSRLSYIRKGLDWFCDHWRELGIVSIAFPPLGCGNGGLRWDEVGPLMYDKLKDLPIDIEVYAPYGTPLTQLTEDYLASAPLLERESCGHSPQPYNRAWDLVLYVIGELDSLSGAPYVGRTIYQKICFMLWRQGVPLGFEFQRGDFGPFSRDAQAALTVLANSNRIVERVVGPDRRMVRISPSEMFEFDPDLFGDKELLAARNTVNFFSRVKNTDQAEKYTTLLWCYDECRQRAIGARPADAPCITADGLVGMAVEWKPRWDDPAMREALIGGVYTLAMEGWIDPDEVACGSMPGELF